MEIKRIGSQPSIKGPADWFTGTVRHWHGASPTTAMTHIAIQEAQNGKMVDWMEKVSDEQGDVWLNRASRNEKHASTTRSNAHVHPCLRHSTTIWAGR